MELIVIYLVVDYHEYVTCTFLKGEFGDVLGFILVYVLVILWTCKFHMMKFSSELRPADIVVNFFDLLRCICPISYLLCLKFYFLVFVLSCIMTGSGLHSGAMIETRYAVLCIDVCSWVCVLCVCVYGSIY